ncbi:MAG: HD domain-containing phosphohydrolase [Solirubrobacteraceae bacterium]|nr:HD domain-containing phosphohydrolase [Solirubrobacteraceae bacterium]
MPTGHASPAADQGRFLVGFEVDAHGRVSRWTLGAAQVLGLSAGQAIGRNPPVPPPWRGITSWSDLSASTEPLLDEAVVWLAADGSQHEMAVSSSPSIAADGTVLGVSISARDISARNQVHEQLAVYARDVRETYGRELHRLAELEESYHATVEALAVAVESKDDTTGNHIRRVCRLGMHLAKAHLGCNDDPQLAYGFLLHDVGKIAIPDAVLNKPGKLDPTEWALIQSHPREGSRILEQVPFLDRALDIVLHHHERWDGGGYPSGQRGEEIPVWARLFSIVDSVDAMTSDRPYRAGLPLEAAIAEIQDKSGSQFDPACVATFTALPRYEIQAMLEPHDVL